MTADDNNKQFWHFVSLNGAFDYMMPSGGSMMGSAEDTNKVEHAAWPLVVISNEFRGYRDVYTIDIVAKTFTLNRQPRK